MTRFGAVAFERSRYRPSGTEASIIPAERTLGLTTGGMTPAAAGLARYLMRGLTVSLDGVMMRMKAETATDAGWREAACGVIGFVDADGNMLDARCFGHLPETGKETLKAQLTAELFHWLTVDPDLKVVAVADGARDNGTFLAALCPDLVLLDFWPAAEHLKAAAGFAIGSGSVEAANKVLVTSHLKRSGQSWGRDGGQGALSIRALCQSGRFDRAWEDLVPRRNRQSGWVPASPANDNRALRLALVA
ncbi:MAG: hypothetical protein OXC63_02095 [Aestuariivita sp.]|nr:hypothetical protein [Aestuariivita sp.]MCY4347608.1 hypothetical protein [Aestuariivita sp.]